MPEKGALHPTLFIGLGGTGKEILLRVRRRFYENWRVPALPCTRFLWIDADRTNMYVSGEDANALDEQVKFAEHEFIPLLDGPVGRYFADVFENRSKYRHIHEWLSTDEVTRFGNRITDGCGGVRCIGRLTYFKAFDSIATQIEAALRDITERPAIQDTNTKYLPGVEIDEVPRVVVVCSVAGGTGGGTYLDTAFFLQYLAKRRQIKDVIGIVLLPNVFYPSPRQPESASRAYASSYSALKELEFFTRRIPRRTTRGDEDAVKIDFNVNWKGVGKAEIIAGPPFAITYLIESLNERGVGCGSIAELYGMVSDWLCLDVLPGKLSTNKRMHLSNVAEDLQRVDQDVAEVAGIPIRQIYSRQYATLGISRIEIPLDAIREACACRLAKSIATDWNRAPNENDLRGYLQRSTAAKELDIDGLENTFGTDWLGIISQEIGRVLPAELPSDADRLKQFISELPSTLQATRSRLLDQVGNEQRRWGTIPQAIWNATERAGERLRSRLNEWIGESLDNRDLGLRSLVDEHGLLVQLTDEFTRITRTDPVSAAPAVSKQRKEAARAEAAERQEMCDAAVSGMIFASRSTAAQLLGVRHWTVEYLYKEVREHFEQQLKALGAALVSERTAEVAEIGLKHLSAMTLLLGEFSKACLSVAGDFQEIENKYLEMKRTISSIRVFSGEEEMKKYYLLDFDPTSRTHKQVDAVGEGAVFVKQVFGETATALTLAQRLEEIGAAKGLRSKLHTYAAERFSADFRQCRQNPDQHRDCGRFVEVLKHPLMQQDLDEKLQYLVKCALPMLRRSSKSGKNYRVFLAMKELQSERYRSVAQKVKEGLSRYDYDFRIDDTLATDDPTSIRLIVETYAFSLPSVDLISDECHDYYYEFYRTLQRTAEQDQSRIPLHISTQWEGEFDDLRRIADADAKLQYEALQILSLGPLLGVIRGVAKNGRRTYSYRRYVAPQAMLEELGNKREAIETLKANEELRKGLLRELNSRCERIMADSREDLRIAFFWSMSYLTLQMLFGTPEHNVIQERIEKVQNALATGGREIAMLDESVDLSKRLESCKAQLSGFFDLAEEFPIIKREIMPVFVVGKPDAGAAKA